MWTSEFAVAGLAGSSFGLALATPMVWPFTRRPPEARLLGGLLLGLASGMALICARLAGLLAAMPAVEHLVNLVGFATAPLLVLYVRARQREDWWRDGLAALWLPFALYLAAVLVFGGGASFSFSRLLPAIVAFTALAAGQLWSGRRERGSRATPLPSARWVVLFAALLNLAQVARFALRQDPGFHGLVPLVACLGLIAVAGLLAHQSLGPGTGAARYARSGLDAGRGRALAEAILVRLERERLFADPELNLDRVAAMVGSPRHLVSQAVNEHLAESFHDLVNRLRVAAVAADLRKPDNDRFTIEGLGRDAGFRSRSAFYAAFRRHTGTTPSEYRARVRAERPEHPHG